jgi:hypothetical protein
MLWWWQRLHDDMVGHGGQPSLVCSALPRRWLSSYSFLCAVAHLLNGVVSMLAVMTVVAVTIVVVVGGDGWWRRRNR